MLHGAKFHVPGLYKVESKFDSSNGFQILYVNTKEILRVLGVVQMVDIGITRNSK